MCIMNSMGGMPCLMSRVTGFHCDWVLGFTLLISSVFLGYLAAVVANIRIGRFHL